MRINQVIVTASPEDAATNSALELRSLLRGACPSDLFARHIHPDLAHDVLPLSEYQRRCPTANRDDLLVFHASIGEPEVFSFLLQRPERIVLMYHNISPSGLFLPFDPAFAARLEGGRREVASLKDRVVLAMAVSAYNANELREFGYRDVRVATIIADPHRMTAITPDLAASRRLAGLGGPVLLFVGQVLPHKRPDLLLKAFHILVTYLVPEARLLMVGNTQRLPAYRNTLKGFCDELNLTWAFIEGEVTDAELVAYYRRADVFVTASEHEGVCVPLLEAMTFEVPVIARAHAAIPETLGDAGLLLPPDDDPALLAEALAELIYNSWLRRDLVAKGRARLGAFDHEQALGTFVEHLLSVA